MAKLAKVVLKRSGDVEANGIIVGRWAAEYPRKQYNSRKYVKVLYVAVMEVRMKIAQTNRLEGFTKKELANIISLNV